MSVVEGGLLLLLFSLLSLLLALRLFPGPDPLPSPAVAAAAGVRLLPAEDCFPAADPGGMFSVIPCIALSLSLSLFLFFPPFRSLSIGGLLLC